MTADVFGSLTFSIEKEKKKEKEIPIFQNVRKF